MNGARPSSGRPLGSGLRSGRPDATVAWVTIPSPDNAQQLHDTGQDALLELELATLEMNADEKWMLEQLLLTYVADSVPSGDLGRRLGGRSARRPT